jgi:uncharacterized membrane protein (UPF0127 family)
VILASLAFALKTATLVIGDTTLLVEIARTNEEKCIGLMHRDSLAQDQGMLFVYETPQRLSFWMKNTKIPLDIGFFNSDQVLVQIEQMEPFQGKDQSHPVYKSASAAKFALEVPMGWFEERKIQPGIKFNLQPNNPINEVEVHVKET